MNHYQNLIRYRLKNTWYKLSRSATLGTEHSGLNTRHMPPSGHFPKTLSCSRLACGSFLLQKYLSTAGAVVSSCDPVVTQRRARKSVEGSSSEELSRTSHLRARCSPLYRRVPSFVSLPLCLNFEHFMIHVL
jgi:hypothetical protein